MLRKSCVKQIRNTALPATSVNKDVIVISNCCHPKWDSQPWRKLSKERKTCCLVAITLQPLPMVSPEETQDSSLRQLRYTEFRFLYWEPSQQRWSLIGNVRPASLRGDCTVLCFLYLTTGPHKPVLPLLGSEEFTLREFWHEDFGCQKQAIVFHLEQALGKSYNLSLQFPHV